MCIESVLVSHCSFLGLRIYTRGGRKRSGPRSPYRRVFSFPLCSFHAKRLLYYTLVLVLIGDRSVTWKYRPPVDRAMLLYVCMYEIHPGTCTYDVSLSAMTIKVITYQSIPRLYCNTAYTSVFVENLTSEQTFDR